MGRIGGADIGRIGGADMGGGAIIGGTMPLPSIGGPDICAAGVSGRCGIGGAGMLGRRISIGSSRSVDSRYRPPALGRAKPVERSSRSASCLSTRSRCRSTCHSS